MVPCVYERENACVAKRMKEHTSVGGCLLLMGVCVGRCYCDGGESPIIGKGGEACYGWEGEWLKVEGV